MRRIFILILFFGFAYGYGQKIILNPYDGVNFSNYYKSSLHNHTNLCDGSYSPAYSIYLHANADYDIQAITDHDACSDPAATSTTWPWTTWISETPTTIYTDSNGGQVAALYPSLNGGNAMLAIRGNEITSCSLTNLENHVTSLFSDLGYYNCPTGQHDTYFTAIKDSGGMAIFNHPMRSLHNAAWYNGYFDDYPDSVLIGMEVFNHGYGELYPYIRDGITLWDSVNATRDYDDLRWGFSGDDWHSSPFGHNYNRHYMPSLTYPFFRANLKAGAFTFSYQKSSGGIAAVPILTGVTVAGSSITIMASGATSIAWVDNKSDTVDNDYSVDVCALTTNFIRAVLTNDYGATYTQPFGITVVSDPIIITQPVGATICCGGTHSMSVIVSGGMGLTYLWQESPDGFGSWTNVGSNSPVFTTPSLTSRKYYKVIISSSGVGCTSPLESEIVTVSQETEPPTFTIPADITIYKDSNCSYDASATVTGDVNDEYDNCDASLDATFTDVVTLGTCDGKQIITRNWSLMDDCGNTTTHEQIITVTDTTHPIFTGPADITIYKDSNCSYDASATITGEVNDEDDNCDTSLAATYSDVIGNGSCEDERIITRTWSLTDDCGNTTENVQIISVIPEVEIGGPYESCEGKNIELDAGRGFISYLWNTDDTTQRIEVTESGVYSVTVTNSLGFSVSDETQVTFFSLPDPQIPEDTTMLATDTLALDAGSVYPNYLWSTGSEDRVIMIYDLPVGKYLYALQVTDENGCVGYDSTRVIVIAGTYLQDPPCNLTFEIYPVPGKDLINVKPRSNYDEEVTIRIMDISGRILQEIKFEKLYKTVACPVDISRLADGSYYLSISSRKMIQVERIAKISGR